MTIEEFLQEIITVFKKVGIECAENEAYMLASHVLSLDKTYLMLHKDEEIDDKVLLASAALINERCKLRPLAYIIGSANFYGYEITVDERVLIPRPETEVMVEQCINLAKKMEKPSILDLCTGSGCISVALANNLPQSSILASDLSLKALQLARYNCKGLDNISFVKSDLFDNIQGEFDIIITNPPYVAERDRESLQTDVKDFEPEMALFSGEDGLDLIKKLIPESVQHLKSGGVLLLEHAEDQTDEIERLAKDFFVEIRTEKDLAGHDRFLWARKGYYSVVSQTQ